MITLRPLRAEDADDLVLACNDPEIQRFVPSLPSPYTREHALWWINEGCPTIAGVGGMIWAICDPDTDRLLGSVSVRPLTIGYWVAPWARGRGLATEAALRGTAWAFEHGYERLELTTHPENAVSQRVALAAGFRPEGTRRAAERGRDGTRHDMLIWSRLPADPPGPTPRRLPDLPGGELTDGVVTLRPCGPADADHLYRLVNLPEVVATSVPPVPKSREHIEQRCARAAAAWLAGERCDLVVWDAASDTRAGDLGLLYLAPPLREAMIGYATLPEFRGRGLTARAADLITAWAFEHTEILRMTAGTAPDNLGSHAVLTRAGFTREGLQRGRLPGPDDTRLDDLLWARLP